MAVEIEKTSVDTIKITRQSEKYAILAFRKYGGHPKQIQVQVGDIISTYVPDDYSYQTIVIGPPTDDTPIYIKVVGVAADIYLRREVEKPEILPVKRDVYYLIIANNIDTFPSTETVHILIVMENHGGGIPQGD